MNSTSLLSKEILDILLKHFYFISVYLFVFSVVVAVAALENASRKY